MTSATTSSPKPLTGLYVFVRDHLSVFNGVMLASGTLVAVLDFLGPRLSILPKLVYSATLAIVLLMIAAALAPALVRRVLAAVGLTALRDDLIPVWRKPLWQITIALLSVVTVVGFASVARANQGGLLASNSTSVKSWQDAFLSLKADVAEVGSGVRDANAKLDAIAIAVDPDKAAERCPDLECAVYGGASSKTIRRLFAKGVKVPGNPVMDGVLLRMAAFSRSADRLENVDLIFQNGIDRNMRIGLPTVLGPGELTRDGIRWAREVVEVSSFHRIKPHPTMPGEHEDVHTWNDMAACIFGASEGMTLLELAALRGDSELVSHLLAGGSKPLARPLVCSIDFLGKRGYARVVFDGATGKVLGVKRAPA